MIRITILSLFSLLVISMNARAQASVTTDSVQVTAAINHFVDVFSNLQWEEFTQCFADDATAFFPPSARFPYRANNKKEVMNIFKGVFENARNRATGAPYIVIQPKDVKIQLTPGFAIVTFLLEDPDLLGRRTIILRKDKANWRIIHLHASGVAAVK